MAALTPEEAVDRLEALHGSACYGLRSALTRFATSGVPPTAQERAAFRYPELCVDWQRAGPIPYTRRAWAKFPCEACSASSKRCVNDPTIPRDT